MTNTPARTSPYEQLINHICAGNEVKIGEWIISNAKELTNSSSDNGSRYFVATLENHTYHSGQSFESSIQIKPSEKENISGLKVDLTVEIYAKLESHFEGLGFSTPIGQANTKTMPAKELSI